MAKPSRVASDALALQFLVHSITPMGHPPRIPVWLKWDQPVINFLTFGVANRQKVLANDIAFAAFKGAIARLTKWNVIAAIVMPITSIF